MFRVLLVEDDESIRFGVARHLERNNFVVAEATNCEDARERFASFKPNAVVTDFSLPDGNALQLVAHFRELDGSLPVVVFTGYGSIELAVQAIRTGAYDLLTKPVDMDKLVEELRRVIPAAGAHERGARRAALPLPFNFQQEIERLKDVECSVLVFGETGSGKTSFVRALHDASRRRDRAFIDLNCAGLTRELVESELFGHERGAFTSAHATKPGMFELADGGTLFLDEIGDIDMAVQPKILKAIEEKRFRRLGSARELRSDVRIVAATHLDLQQVVRDNRFRADLFYRLSTVTVTLPSLRDRRGDIPDLARSILASLATRLGRAEPELDAGAVDALTTYPWPGNIRELKNVLERAMHMTRSDRLAADDLGLPEPETNPALPAAGSLRDMERVHIERALAVHGHVGEAARSLGISRSSLYLKLKAYGIVPARGSSPRLKIGGAGGS